MKKNLKKLVSGLMAATMAMSLAACGSNQTAASAAAQQVGTKAGETEGIETKAAVKEGDPLGSETFNYVFGHGAAENSIGDLYCKKFEEFVEAKSGGAITVDVYSGNQLGSYPEMMQSLASGDIGGMIFQPSPAVSFVPELAVLDIPYAFLGKTQEQIDHALNHSEWTDILKKSMDKSGYKFISFAQAATFRETTSNKELRTADDFKGLNIRTLENNNHIAFWKSVGANPTPIAFSELYLSLQQGLVDAQENPYDTSLNAGFPEVQKYLVQTDHILYPNIFIVNKAEYESMPDNYRAVFDDAAEEARAYAEDLMKESAEHDKQALIDAGMEFIELPNEEKQKMAEAGAGVIDLVKGQVGEDTVDKFLAALQ